MVGDTVDDVTQMRLGIRPFKRAGPIRLYIAVAPFAAGVRADKRIIPRYGGNTAQGPPSDQVIDLRLAAVAVVDQRRPAVQRVPDRFGHFPAWSTRYDHVALCATRRAN